MAMAPSCLNPYSSPALFNNVKKPGLVKHLNSTTNLFGSSHLTATTANCPSFTSFGTTFFSHICSNSNSMYRNLSNMQCFIVFIRILVTNVCLYPPFPPYLPMNIFIPNL
ncbi:hypothetical protein HanPI659440_Chr11g0438341 [Helianthus annuus]|nr:hypothetical protein HanPI659440_Chr11g0438341 [Helianthus annuus]